MLLDKVKAALNDSVVDGIFEELDMEQMEILKGAGRRCECENITRMYH